MPLTSRIYHSRLVTYVLHASVYILARLLIFRFLRTQLFLYFEIFFLCFLHFSKGSIVCKTAVLKFFACSLQESVRPLEHSGQNDLTWYSFIWAKDRSSDSSQLEVALAT